VKQVLIISVNYNSTRSIKGLIESIRALRIDHIKLSGLMLDITEDLEEGVLPDSFLRIKIPENRGYAYALNVGLKMALEMGVDYCWILNPDIVLNTDSLSPLVTLSLKNPRALIGSAVYSLEDGELSSKPWGLGGFIDFSGEVSMGNEIPRDLKGDTGVQFFECDYVPGCSIFLPTSILSEVSYLPENYFLYFEETEWCLRAKAKDIRSIISIDSKVWHGTYQGKAEELFRVYFYNRSKKLFAWRNKSFFGIDGSFILQNVKSLFVLLSNLYRAPKDMKNTFKAHFYAALDFLLISFLIGDRRRAAYLSRLRLKNLS
jgi:GT2 family glycosyltransferase